MQTWPWSTLIIPDVFFHGPHVRRANQEEKVCTTKLSIGYSNSTGKTNMSSSSNQTLCSNSTKQKSIKFVLDISLTRLIKQTELELELDSKLFLLGKLILILRHKISKPNTITCIYI
jgi:hypothetical protein